MDASTNRFLSKLTTLIQGREAHVALTLANVFFGVGAVVGALGITATHPLKFALIREFWAGLILLGISYHLYQSNSDTSDNGKSNPTAKIQPLTGWRPQWKSFAILGMLIFGNQGAFIVGIKLAGPVTASVWQPSQPIITAAISMGIGSEPVIQKRLAGVLVASMGCVAMVLLKHQKQKQSQATEVLDDMTTTTNSYLIGNALFFCNCLCHSIYVILSKRMLKLYPALCVTAWSYNVASVYMLLANLFVATLPNSILFFCPECPPEDGLFHLPQNAIPALLYYIFFASVGSYGLITWANQHATGTLVTSYNVLQPVTSAVLTTILLTLGVVLNCQTLLDPNEKACLEFPTLGTFCGMMGVFTGLSLIISTEPKKEVPGGVENDDDLETVPLAKMMSTISTASANGEN